MAPAVLTKDDDLFALVNSFPEAYLFVGFSEKAQFGNVDEVVAALDVYMAAAQKRCAGKPFLIVYGGDPIHVPTIGSVVKALQSKYSCHILAIQAAGKHEDWVDTVFIAEQHFEVVKRVKDGVEQEVKETLYGGTRNGKPVGGARYYMGDVFYGRPQEGVPGAINLTFFLGGGGIAAEELAYADSHGAPWVYLPSKCKNVAAYNSTFGPVHDWVVHKLAHGTGRLALCGNSLQP